MKAGIHCRPSLTEQLCAGGRYDDLVSYLGGRNRVPAVGFAIGVERVVLIQAEQAAERAAAAPGNGAGGPTDAPGQALDEPAASPADVIVVSGGDVDETAVVRAVAQFRHGGLRAVHLNGRRVRYGLTQALKSSIPFLAVVGRREAENNLITLRDLANRSEQSMPVDRAVAVVAEAVAAVASTTSGLGRR